MSGPQIIISYIADDPSSAERAAAVLERADERFAVTPSTTFATARTGIDGELDCIVADYDLSGTNGIERLEAVRDDDPELPIVLVAENGSESVASEAIVAGVSAYVPRSGGSIPVTALADRIRTVTDRRIRNQALSELNAAATDLVDCPEPEAVYHRMIDAAEAVLGVDRAAIAVEDGDGLAVQATSSAPSQPAPSAIDIARGIAVDAFRTGDAIHTDAEPGAGEDRLENETAVCAVISVPIGEYGVLQAVTGRSGGFDDRDLELAESLARHAEAAFDRLDRERELESIREKVEFALDATDSVIWSVDLEAGSASRIGSFERLFRTETVAPDESWGFRDGIHPEDRDEFARVADRVGEGRADEFNVVVRTNPKYGPVQWIRSAGYAQVSGEGRRIIGLATNVTEQKERERELESIREKVEFALDPTDSTVWSVDLETDEVSSIGPGERILQSGGVVDDPEAFRDSIHPDDRAKFDRNIDRIERGLTDEFDVEIRTNPERGPVQWIRSTGYAKTDDGGQQLIGLGTDITERKRRERELQAIYDRVEFALNATDSVIWWVEPDTGSGKYIGPLEQLFEDGGEIEGLPSFSKHAVHADDRAAFDAEFERLKRGETDAIDVEFRAKQRRDESQWFRCTGYAQKIGEERRLAGITTNITGRKRKKRELKRQNERLEEFASVVSHDLRNPLNVADGRLELAREGRDGDGDHLAEVAWALDRMRTLIDDLLVLAREGTRAREPEPVDLAACCRDCWRSIDASNATLEIDTGRTVVADASRLRQLLENLFRNAVEHGSTRSDSQAQEDSVERGPDLTITVGDFEGGFYVEDDGPGIPPAERERMFETGYSTSAEGTGFGLVIVREVAKDHGWEIAATDGAAGGARFEITGLE